MMFLFIGSLELRKYIILRIERVTGTSKVYKDKSIKRTHQGEIRLRVPGSKKGRTPRWYDTEVQVGP